MSGPKRRSTAAQFFLEDDIESVDQDVDPTDQGNDISPGSKRKLRCQQTNEHDSDNDADTDIVDVPPISDYDKVVELLNQASLKPKEKDRIKSLNVVKELIVYNNISLLDNFLDEVLAFQRDKSAEVRKAVASFLEEACKTDPSILTKVMTNMAMLLQDENVAVVKRVLIALTHIYKATLKWIVNSKKSQENMAHTWQFMTDMKHKALEMLESDNDGIRTHSIKFLESVVVILSEKTDESDILKRTKDDISLDQIPKSHPILNWNKLCEEGKKAFEAIMSYQGSQHISSVNLMTCMVSVTSIATQRPQFMQPVVQALETLHVNLPPTLAKSQVASVRKNLKIQLLILLKHPSSYLMQQQISTLLTDLGATHAEVMKNMPKIDESRKRKMIEEAEKLKSKKAKLLVSEKKKAKEAEDGKKQEELKEELSLAPADPKSLHISESDKQMAINVTSEDLVARLTAQNVSDLVLLSMVMLPDTMPASFQATYTPIAAAGTDAQIKHLSRLLATQLTAAGLGRGVTQAQKNSQKVKEAEEADATGGKQIISTVIGGTVEEKSEAVAPSSFSTVIPRPSKKGVKPFKLATVTTSLAKLELQYFSIEAFKRILRAEESAYKGGVNQVRMKIIASLVTMFKGQFQDVLRDFIFKDFRKNIDLAIAWIYQEYSVMQQFTCQNLPGGDHKKAFNSYDACLGELLDRLLRLMPDNREGFFDRMILGAPCITPKAIAALKKYCQGEGQVFFGMSTLKDLIIKRPSMNIAFLQVLLELANSDVEEVRSHAMRVTRSLYTHERFREKIQETAVRKLQLLSQPAPPNEIYTNEQVGEDFVKPTIWTEEPIRRCLSLYLGLLPANHALVMQLAQTYTSTQADIKRVILRMLDVPVRGMGMESPELLKLVESCPKGAETLVTRIIHILTDRAIPTPQLVQRVRELYQKRVSDVRFLIPVLNGLEKEEVIAALPKLIKLNPVVVKEVFHRLLAGTGEEGATSAPLTPAELLIALHSLDANKVDMKTVIKACNMLFVEKNVYTQEELALVMQTLMEQSPLPVLLMRTVIQSLTMYPKLIGLVMNIMQRLISKQVWKQKKIWDGFVKCCQRTKPQSFQVLLQLPATQLRSVFELSPDLREPLLSHVQGFTVHQRAHIPKSIMTILERDPNEENELAEKAKKDEDERLATEERLYQQRLEEEKHAAAERRYQEKLEEQRKKKSEPTEERKTKSDEVTCSTPTESQTGHHERLKQETGEEIPVKEDSKIVKVEDEINTEIVLEQNADEINDIILEEGSNKDDHNKEEILMPEKESTKSPKSTNKARRGRSRKTKI